MLSSGIICYAAAWFFLKKHWIFFTLNLHTFCICKNCENIDIIYTLGDFWQSTKKGQNRDGNKFRFLSYFRCNIRILYFGQSYNPYSKKKNKNYWNIWSCSGHFQRIVLCFYCLAQIRDNIFYSDCHLCNTDILLCFLSLLFIPLVSRYILT